MTSAKSVTRLSQLVSRLRIRFVLFASLLAIGIGSVAIPQTAEIHGPLSADEARKHIRLPPGLKIELVAAEPDVQSPAAIAFDEDGRLWVVEMRDYPNGPAKGQPAEGRIKRLEDRDGSGRYRSTGVFADQLLFANGVLPWKGGLLVTSAPHILFLQDIKGMGQADRREPLYEGFAVDNPQLRVSHPNLGIDNRIYVANGLRGGQVRRSGRAGAEPVNISGRDFRFDLLRDREEAIAGMGQFGNTFDDWGRRFVCTNRNHWVHLPLPERYVKRNPYLAVPPPRRIDQGPGGAARVYPLSRQVTTAAEHAGTFTAACGVFVYRGTALPAEYRGAIFTCEPTGNLVHQEILLPSGASFTGRPARQGVEFLATPDDWCRPVFLTQGPDGALYIVDMYRRVIEHPQWLPAGKKNPPGLLDGKDMGRIWRIVPEKKTVRKPPRLSKATTKELVGLLEDRDAWWRTTAQRLLLERQDPAADEPLRKLVLSSAEPLARVHAAWLLEHRGKLDVETVMALLKHAEPRVREHGVRLAEPWIGKSEAIQKRLIELANDPDAQLRFQVALSLGEWDDDRILQPLGQIASAGVDDSWTRLAAASAVPKRAGSLIRAILQGDFVHRPNRDRLQLIEELATVVGGRQDPSEVADLLEALLGLNGKQAGVWLVAGRKGLAEGMARRGTQLAMFLQKLPPLRRGLIDRLNDRMEKTIALARDGKGSAPARFEAVAVLSQLDWKTASPILSKLIADDPAAEIRLAAVRAVAAFPNPEVGGLLVKTWVASPDPVRRELIEALLARPERTLSMLSELETGRIKAEDLDGLRRIQLLNHRRSDVRDRAKKLFAGLATPERKKVLDQFRPALKLTGDPRRGRDIFQKATCISCHRVGDLGNPVGPDISDTRTKTPEMLLVDILDPNAAIDANFVSYIVSLKSGKVLTGLIAQETASSITLRRADNQTDVVLRPDIEPDGILSTGKSLMPEGLEKGLSAQDMADLLAFLRRWNELKGKKEELP